MSAPGLWKPCRAFRRCAAPACKSQRPLGRPGPPGTCRSRRLSRHGRAVACSLMGPSCTPRVPGKDRPPGNQIPAETASNDLRGWPHAPQSSPSGRAPRAMLAREPPPAGDRRSWTTPGWRLVWGPPPPRPRRPTGPRSGAQGGAAAEPGRNGGIRTTSCAATPGRIGKDGCARLVRRRPAPVRGGGLSWGDMEGRRDTANPPSPRAPCTPRATTGS